jgi:predicted acetyltransferase
MQFSSMKRAELKPVCEMLGAAFGFPSPDAIPWLKNAKHENVRVVREGRRPVACLVVVPMGQYFGGRSVPTTGIAGVAVALEARGRGAARYLMEETLRESAKNGVALSTLFPATQTLYRKVGYERAGKVCEVRLGTHLFSAPKNELVARPLGPRDAPAMTRLYQAAVHDRDGYLDRGPYMWNRIRRPRGKVSFGIGFFTPRTNELEAYVHFLHGESEGAFYTVIVKDAVARSAKGYDAIVRLLGDQRSCGRTTRFLGGPSDPLLMRLAEPHYEEKSLEDWMVRIVDVKRALLARGYPRFLRASVTLDITDELLPQNHATLRLDVDDGRAKLDKATARGALSITARALAPLFTGYLDATRLAALGELSGKTQAIEAADAIFNGPTPAMNEMF